MNASTVLFAWNLTILVSVTQFPVACIFLSNRCNWFCPPSRCRHINKTIAERIVSSRHEYKQIVPNFFLTCLKFVGAPKTSLKTLRWSSAHWKMLGQVIWLLWAWIITHLTLSSAPSQTSISSAPADTSISSSPSSATGSSSDDDVANGGGGDVDREEVRWTRVEVLVSTLYRASTRLRKIVEWGCYSDFLPPSN